MHALWYLDVFDLLLGLVCLGVVLAQQRAHERQGAELADLVTILHWYEQQLEQLRPRRAPVPRSSLEALREVNKHAH